MIPTFVRWQWNTSRVWCVWKSKSRLCDRTYFAITLCSKLRTITGPHYLRRKWSGLVHGHCNVSTGRWHLPIAWRCAYRQYMRRITRFASHRMLRTRWCNSTTNWAVVGHGALSIPIAYHSLQCLTTTET